MPVLHVPYSEELLVATGLTSEQLEPELRFLLAVKLYELGRVSAGQAGKLAGMARLLSSTSSAAGAARSSTSTRTRSRLSARPAAPAPLCG